MNPKLMKNGIFTIVNDYYDDRLILYEFFYYFCEKNNPLFDEDKFRDYYKKCVDEYNTNERNPERGIWNENQLNNQYV